MDPSQVTSLETFLENLIRASHPEATLEDYMIEDMKKELRPRLTRFLVLKAMEELAQKSPQSLGELQLLAKDGTQPEEVQRFIEAKIPDAPAFIAKTLMDFQTLYQSGSQG